MSTVTMADFQENLSGYMNAAVEFSETVRVTTGRGNAVILSEEDYQAMLETCYLMGVPGMVERIEEARKTPIEESERFEWD
ncbi:MAG: type II toxin-antitoxin system Phd/YefM family antitoxin [Clostridia bacterium]|nr:type II toxin-antitoxin system Phd/YefM family antitoxin [Clostridia bacterium]